jgi:CheY-like chemotaxis protein
VEKVNADRAKRDYHAAASSLSLFLPALSPESPDMPRILSISRNPRLLALRNDALALAGYAVAAPREPDEAIVLASQQSFDAVVVGHSVEHETRETLIRSLRDLRPDFPILFAYTEPETPEPLADVSVDVTHGPTPLVTALDRRLRRAQSA